ncbi:YggS family pyridoxal phosphate-dependent enzyme [Brachybacterium endophyticum]|uniref:Pyridoxal phosphate homeostasis protein n=1 Tax=Brachybacterium endophyticum TaxID=2182385 RepID=A0A2U2RP98_9MICO|nr:YggS family pyridoxal phosphate-dependent enzyme [Brachybacterium endophyticum]PWH07661.1 YggS family pyridoxal phosphate-dependent enzyme [Brachybacterium endophyticum]
MTSTPGTTPVPDLEQRLDGVLGRIESAAERAGRDPREILVLLATKTREPGEIAAAVRAVHERGWRVAVGENRAQEIAKHEDPALAALESELGVPRHFIGRLQRNKARDVVDFASVIHGVDRDGIIDALARRAELAGTQRDVLVQVNTSGEESKGGFVPSADVLADAVTRIRATGVLRPVGLMTIGAHTSEESAVRSSLRLLRTLRDELADPQIVELSMGMSGDLEIAVEEGASIVRPGSAVFGPREG